MVAGKPPVRSVTAAAAAMAGATRASLPHARARSTRAEILRALWAARPQAAYCLRKAFLRSQTTARSMFGQPAGAIPGPDLCLGGQGTVGTLRGGDGAKLSQQPELVPIVPSFRNLATFNSKDYGPGDQDAVSSWRQS